MNVLLMHIVENLMIAYYKYLSRLSYIRKRRLVWAILLHARVEFALSLRVSINDSYEKDEKIHSK